MSDHTLSSSMPTADESSLPTKLNAHIHAALLDDMMPGVIASDERDTRRFQADKRRLAGISLTVNEIHHDLADILSQLATRLLHHEQGVSSLLKTPAQTINYIERTTAYAIKDYPREFDANKDIESLWDTLDLIHTESYGWRQGAHQEDGETLIALIKNIIIQTLDQADPNMADINHARTEITPDAKPKDQTRARHEVSEDREMKIFLSDTSLDEADNAGSRISSDKKPEKAARSTSLPPDYNPFDLDW